MDFATVIKLNKLEGEVDELATAVAKLAKAVELMRTNFNDRLKQIETESARYK